MGKALIVAGTVVIVAVAVIVLIGWLRRQTTKEKAADKGWALKGDLNKNQERQLIKVLDQAALLLRDMATPYAAIPSIDLALTSTLLSPEDRARVETWLREYNATVKEISNR